MLRESILFIQKSILVKLFSYLTYSVFNTFLLKIKAIKVLIESKTKLNIVSIKKLNLKSRVKIKWMMNKLKKMQIF